MVSLEPLKGATLARAVDKACRQAFAARGYRLPRQGAITLEITPECWGWVGLNLGTSDDNTAVHPFVGIHCPVVHRIRARCDGKPYQTGSIATFAVPFIEAAPDADLFWWRFYQEDPIEPRAEELAAAVDEQAQPFMLAHASYDKLIRLLTPMAHCGGGVPERLAILYYLTDGPERAQQYLEEVLPLLRRRPDSLIAEDVARFATVLEAVMRENARDARRD